ncbi:MAG: adenylate/guanylate cyclase domain-containing protein, partial [Nitrospinae bacterium]|nr:adenylate/guanylate cyclase domain-containing protein [Nitrospinota bacterium]
MASDASAAASSVEHWRRRMSLGSGCVLFLFLITHLLNHTLGLASLAAMDAGRFWFLGFWRSVPGSVLFYSSLILHTALAMYGLFGRRSLKMPLWEGA